MRFIVRTPRVREPMTARSVFSLRTSAFNDFLYATVGDEDNGMVLTMLSVLARCGVDPWNEAARLNELPTEAATKRLTLMISGQPRGQWAKSAAADIASRLVALLPVKQSSDVTVQVKAPPDPPRKMMFFLSVILILVSAQVLTVLSGRERSPPIEQAHIVDAPQTSPPAVAK